MSHMFGKNYILREGGLRLSRPSEFWGATGGVARSRAGARHPAARRYPAARRSISSLPRRLAASQKIPREIFRRTEKRQAYRERG